MRFWIVLFVLAQACLSALPGFDSLNRTLLARGTYAPSGFGGANTSQFQIDDSLMTLSPGDVLRLRWWGVGNGDVALVVNSQNQLVIPDIGIVRTADVPYGQVRDSILSMIERRVKTKMIDLQIQSLNPALVSVSGITRRPGLIEMTSGTRLSIVLGLVGWDVPTLFEVLSTTSPFLTQTPLPSVRRIKLIRGPKRDTTYFDLAKAYRKGDPKCDPRLFNGDQIVLLSPEAVVAVSGSLPTVGFAEYIPGETFASFFEALGVKPGLDSIWCFFRGGRSAKFNERDTLPASLEAIHLYDSRVPTPPSVVWVRGYVRAPGVYPFRPGVKTKELIEMAGGYTIPADSVILVGLKRDWPQILNGRLVQSVYEGTQYSELRIAIQEQKVRASGNYSSKDPMLQPGDTLDVRMVEKVVWVGGQVGKPGFVPWIPGGDIDDYVEAAGGYGSRPWKSKARLEDLFTHQIIGDGVIRPGTAIIIPERKYIYMDQWITVAATTVSLLVTTVALYIQIRAQ